ncbi:transcriptional initiation protein Tat [Amylibacter kogurei]|uniref:Transcriptional initiation protein Tat n=1 Tax=Paramylibacter kogurei TaxID=1889778 RepID=A0A2G5K327_9RHOB|nr:PhoX family phosphatase [Amylibacter kogurei]PIB23938.1 transcriptional initiation protein Tat [Amylibacter kogurei]
MKDLDTEISFDEFDEINYPRPETCEFDDVVETAISRRGFLSGVLTFGAGSFVVGTSTLIEPAFAHTSRFAFDAIAANTDDTITVPNGYTWDMLVKWGDPLWSDGAELDETTGGDAASQARAFGDHNDGMSVFSHQGKQILVANNEYTNLSTLYANRETQRPENADDVAKGKNAHGVTVVEISETNGKWAIVKDSPFNRRITADTPMQLTGPAAGHKLMQTAADPSGTKSLGTWNNCGNGETPWGTYLACEENFNGYFSSSDENFDVPARMKRYGIGLQDWGYAWATSDERFDISKNPNEPNRAGYVVEIDPTDPSATPKKRTALGRFKHENADVVIAPNGKVVVYMGDDERGEFLYKFVSEGYYSQGGNTDDMLDSGTLYAAKFSADQRGEWLALTPETTGLDLAEICIHTRQAASIVGATTMDRPEWVATNPTRVEAYVALTNNKNRGVKPNAGGDESPVEGPNPRAENHYGQIVRWVPDEQDHTSTTFTWDIYALAGNPDVHDDTYAGSENINAGNMFNSPDGIIFDSNGMLWIQTDGNYSNAEDFAGMGNNQMLVGDPVTGEIRRFLVGPKEAEVTGLSWSADRKTMFVGIQHPGEKGNSHFPHGGNRIPRSGVIAIRRNDGQTIG